MPWRWKAPVLTDEAALLQAIARMHLRKMLLQGHRDRAHRLRAQTSEIRTRSFEVRMAAQALRARFRELSAQRRALSQAGNRRASVANPTAPAHPPRHR